MTGAGLCAAAGIANTVAINATRINLFINKTPKIKLWLSIGFALKYGRVAIIQYAGKPPGFVKTVEADLPGERRMSRIPDSCDRNPAFGGASGLVTGTVFKTAVPRR